MPDVFHQITGKNAVRHPPFYKNLLAKNQFNFHRVNKFNSAGHRPVRALDKGGMTGVCNFAAKKPTPG